VIDYKRERLFNRELFLCVKIGLYEPFINLNIIK
ncbi:uncharacterized protein METZ01_LOCUS349977, partial [marine metagenome]